MIDTLTETDIAYLAGLTDGDGSILVTHTNRLRTYYPQVCWAMTHRPTIDWVSVTLSATTVVQNNHTNMRTGRTTWGTSKFKVQWRTSIAGTRAQRLCRRMLPYLKTRAAQAALVIEFPCDQRRAPGLTLSEEIAAIRQQLGLQISALNHA